MFDMEAKYADIVPLDQVLSALSGTGRVLVDSTAGE
jgi:hypothetical protein